MRKQWLFGFLASVLMLNLFPTIISASEYAPKESQIIINETHENEIQENILQQMEEQQEETPVETQESEVAGLEILKIHEERNDVYPYRVMFYSENSWKNRALANYGLRLTYSDGTTGKWLNPLQLKDAGITITLKDKSTGTEVSGASSDYLPIGQYEITANHENFSVHVVDFEVKALKDCEASAWSLSSPITINPYEVVKFEVTEKAVYQFTLDAQSEYDYFLSVREENNEIYRSVTQGELNEEKNVNFYLTPGTYYIHGYYYSSPVEISAKKKVVANVEMTQLPTLRQRIIKQDEIDSLDNMWNTKSKLHSNMKFKLTYTDGSSDEMDYIEYGISHNYTGIIGFYTKNWWENDIDYSSKQTGVYFEEIMFEEEGYTWWDNPLAKIKFYICPEFSDVSEDGWEYEAVSIISAEGIMTGLNETTFGPNDKLARAQFATIIYRMENEPETTFKPTFPDVADGMWYTDPILWANEAGVVTGYTNTGYFGPGDSITREQMAVMMYRYADMKGYDTTKQVNLSSFLDGNSVSSFAKQAMQWCVAEGLITGKYNGTIIDPQGNATRAECATIMNRFIEKYE